MLKCGVHRGRGLPGHAGARCARSRRALRSRRGAGRRTPSRRAPSWTGCWRTTTSSRAPCSTGSGPDGQPRPRPESATGVFTDPTLLPVVFPGLIEEVEAHLVPAANDHRIIDIDYCNNASAIYHLEPIDDIVIREWGAGREAGGGDAAGGPPGQGRLHAEARRHPAAQGEAGLAARAAAAPSPNSYAYREIRALFNRFPTRELFYANVQALKEIIDRIVYMTGDDEIAVHARKGPGYVALDIAFSRLRYSYKDRAGPAPGALADAFGPDLLRHLGGPGRGEPAPLLLRLRAARAPGGRREVRARSPRGSSPPGRTARAVALETAFGEREGRRLFDRYIRRRAAAASTASPRRPRRCPRTSGTSRSWRGGWRSGSCRARAEHAHAQALLGAAARPHRHPAHAAEPGPGRDRGAAHPARAARRAAARSSTASRSRRRPERIAALVAGRGALRGRPARPRRGARHRRRAERPRARGRPRPGARSRCCARCATTCCRSARTTTWRRSTACCCATAAVAARPLPLLRRALRPQPARATARPRWPRPSRRVVQALESVRSLAEDEVLRGLDNLVRSALRTNFYQRPERPVVSIKVDSRKVEGMPSPRPHVRDLRPLAAAGGHPPARRQGGPRRHPLERPPRRLPHRGPGPDEDPDGEELDHRARRLQGRLRAQGQRAAAARPRRVPDRPLPRVRRPACSTSPTTSWTARCCTRPRWCATTATIPTWWWRPTRAPPTSPTPPTASPRSTASGWATPSPPAAASGYDHKKVGITARGAWECVKHHFRNLGHDVQTAALHLAGHRRHVGRRVRQRRAAEPGHEAGGRLQPRAHLHRPRPRSRAGATRSASGCSSCPRSALARLRRRADQQGRRRLRPLGQGHPALARR